MDLKFCPKCNQHRPLVDFKDAILKSGKKRKRAYCISCETTYRREYERRRKQNDSEYKHKKRKWLKAQHHKLRDKFNQNKWGYLIEHPCVDCGESDPVVLDFDHRNPNTKKFTITQARKKKWEEVLAEIEKCDVRCANCHRRKTAKQFGWYPGLI